MEAIQMTGPNGRRVTAEPNRLRAFRGRRSISFVAKILNTSITTVRLHESMELPVSAKHLDAYSELYGVPVKDLFEDV